MEVLELGDLEMVEKLKGGDLNGEAKGWKNLKGLSESKRS
jgi:hypothetical protein